MMQDPERRYLPGEKTRAKKRTLMSYRTAEDLIRGLSLRPHPEGGYFREVYRSRESIEGDALPRRFKGSRSFSTGIYFLLTADTFSALHRIASDEVWHFYAGQPLDIEILHPDGRHETIPLGNDPASGRMFQAMAPAGCWFGARLADGAPADGFTLVGCTVAPGFDFQDFEMGDRERLLAAFPRHRELILQLTRTGL